MKELAEIYELDITVNNKPRMRKDPASLTYGEQFNYIGLARWLARWYKCYAYKPTIGKPAKKQ